MYNQCPRCNRKKPHNHKGCNEHNGMIIQVTPQKRKGIKKMKRNLKSFTQIRTIKQQKKGSKKYFQSLQELKKIT